MSVTSKQYLVKQCLVTSKQCLVTSKQCLVTSKQSSN